MKNGVVIWVMFTLFILLTACTLLQKHFPAGPAQHVPPDGISEINTIQKILSNYDRQKKYPGLSIRYPYTDTIFPPEIAAPTFIWEDMNPASNHWLIMVEFNGEQQPIYRLVNGKKWSPINHLWETIKTNSLSVPAEISILGISNKNDCEITSSDKIHIETSEDKVESSFFFRQVPLPFKISNKSFEKTKWRLGDISSYGKPAVVMEKISVCASCHLFSRNGKMMSMEMNYNNDSGSHFLAPVTKHIRLSKTNFFSWNDFPRQGVLPPSRGLFAKMSPTGRYVASTINEISYAVIFKQIDFSQLFFPTYGVLGIYDVGKKKFYLLPGADDYDFVQTNPNWSPDEKYVVFARAKTKNEIHENILNIRTIYDNTNIYTLNKKNNIQFDLYRVAFNQGKGSQPEPIEGASNNGMSNYFPRYSPDGKWIVFTQSKTGIMLQPDSQLFIISASGGMARKMRCNQSLFNSWHSWSTNSRWLLFSSKVNSPYTEIFITHIDEEGNDSPPVLLSRFSEAGYAANVPEFVNIKPDAIQNISLIDHK